MTSPDDTIIVPGSTPCPRCAHPVFGDERFCEACGASVARASVAHPARDPDRPLDHEAPAEVDLDAVGAITDRGYRRARNEDAVAGASGEGWSAVVVCDGVASTSNAHLASRVASQAALVALEAGVTGAADGGAAAVVVRAFVEAQDAVSSLTSASGSDLDLAPSTTAVVVLVTGGTLHVGGVGDSRAYWLGASGTATLLTTDDSLAQDRIAEGIPPDVAYADPDAHTITRWLGADAEPGTPAVLSLPVTESGLVVVCTDGLWNYVEEPDRMAVAAGDWSGLRPIDLARRLVDVALDAGGQDNVTVAVLPVDGSTPSQPVGLP